MTARSPGRVLITGAGKRIGRALALDLAAHGWLVAVHYHDDADSADQTIADIKTAGGHAIALAADLADAQDVATLVDRAAEALGGPLTALINNAALFGKDDILSATPEGWDRHQAINLRAPVFLAQAFARALPVGTDGAVINITDQRVLKPNPQYLSYTAAKAGLWAMTRTLAQGLAPRVRVNAIGPGPTLKNTRQSDADFAAEQAATPLGRGPELSEICAAARFLLECRAMTGQMMALDGGQHLAWRTPDILED